MRYNKYLGLQEVNRVILMMKYDSSLTLNENELFINEQPDEKFMSRQERKQMADVEKERNQKIENEKQRQNQLKMDFDEKFISIKIPKNDYNVETLIIPKNSEINLWEKNVSREQSMFKSWINTQWEKYIPDEDSLRYILPDGTLRNFTTPDGTYFRTKLRRVSENPLTWKFIWYVDENENLYDQKKVLGGIEIPDDYLYKEDGFWDTWGPWILAGMSVLATILFPGSIGIWLSVGIDMIGTVQSLAEGDNMGAFISTVLAFLPVGIGKIPGIGTVTKEESMVLAKKFANATNETEISRIYNGLSKKEQKIFQTAFTQDPEKVVKSLDDVMWKNIVNGLQNGQYNPKELVNIINSMISEGKLKYDDMVKWYQKANIKRFGIDLGATGLILGGTYAYGKQKQRQGMSTIQSIAYTTPKEHYSEEESNQIDKDMEAEMNEQ